MAVHIIGTIKSISDVEAHFFVIMKSKSDVVIYLIGVIVRVNQNKPIHWFEIIKKLLLRVNSLK